MLSAFIPHPASVTTLPEGKFNVYAYFINAAPARIIHNNDNQCQLKRWVLLHTNTCHLEIEPKRPVSDLVLLSLHLTQNIWSILNISSLLIPFVLKVGIKKLKGNNKIIIFKVDKLLKFSMYWQLLCPNVKANKFLLKWNSFTLNCNVYR